MLTRKEERSHTACSYGPTIPSTKENGSTTKRMAKDSFGVQMETRTKATGRTIKPTVSEPSNQTTARRGMSATGKMISTTDKVLKAGLTNPGSMVTSLKERRMGSAHTSGQMAHSTRVTGPTTKCVGRELTSGSMAESTLANG